MDRYIGKWLDNRYELLEIVGTGGMAVVYKALCHRLNRYVAVKILKDEHLVDADFRRRFHDEAQAVAMLSHPNIVSVYDVSSTENTEYIVMELIDGITLKEYLKKKGALSWKETLYFSTQIAKALSHAHKRGIIHRDIKPQNIMLLSDGTIKVADFGIARLMEQRNRHFTQEALGSVHYVAPEQARGSYIDARADLYSLGVVMYEMETGRLPFEGDTPVAVALQHINAIPLSPREVKSDVPMALEDITMKAMSPSLSRRYGSADEMLMDLEKFRVNPGISFDYHNDIKLDTDDETDSEPTQKIDISHERIKGAANSGRLHLNKKRHAPPFFRRKGADKQKESIMDRPMKLGLILSTAFLVCAIIFAWILVNPGGSTAKVSGGSAPNLTGRSYENDILLDENLKKDYVFEVGKQIYDETVPEGNVVSQDPAPGSTINKGDTITLTLSLGTETFKLPDFKNSEYRLAEQQLEKLGLVYRESYEASDEIVQGYVIRTDPTSDAQVKAGDNVTVVISLGAKVSLVKVPSVVGMSEAQAKSTLESAGLLLGDVETIESEKPVGTVVEQKVPAGLEIDEKTGVDVVLSLGTKKPAETGNNGTGGNSGGTPQDPGDTGNNSGEKTVNQPIALKSSPEVQHVVVKLNDVTVYDQIKKASDKQITVPLTGSGSGYLKVYINDVLTYESVVPFN